MESQLDPWLRANLEQPDARTRELVPPDRRERYEAVLRELGAAGLALNEAGGRFGRAQEARQAFFKGLAYD